MIPKQEILQIATDTNLSAQVIEKDYVLGWILAGINRHEALGQSWVFKGGTCLKKCYFETYRFSEDLDFTLKDGAHLEGNFLEDAFSDISEWVYEQSGIEMPVDRMIFDRYKPGSCQGRVFYRGPVTPTSPKQMPRIKLDLTVQELVAEAPVMNLVNHTYSDLPGDRIHIQCYAYIEVFAEKIRALAKRTRPRDLYDVINFFRRPESKNLATDVRRVLQKKCDFKSIPMPTHANLESHREACLVGWTDQLAHQLQALPPFESFWDELQAFFSWLEHPEIIIQPLQDIPSQHGIVHDTAPIDIWRYGSGTPGLGMLDRIRFAAANHLCVEILYTREDGQRNTYIIEPYSLRRSTDSHLLIYALKHQTRDIRAFRTDRIIEAKATSHSFIPSYRVEFLPAGPLNTSVSVSGSGHASLGIPKKPRGTRITTRRTKSSSLFQGAKYVYQCPMCSKKFSKKKMGAKLNPHKNKYGSPCSGKSGIYMGTK